MIPADQAEVSFFFTLKNKKMSYVKVTVLKPGDNKGTGGDKKDKITIIDCDDILTMPDRDSKGVVIAGNIVMKPNTYMIQLYTTQDKTKATCDSEGEPDAKGFVHGVEVAHPGDEVEIREFRSYWVNRNVMIVIERCSNSKKNLYGTPCAPLQMVVKAEDDKDKLISTFTFKSTQKSKYDIADYQGTLTYDTVVGTFAADDATPTVAAGEGRYQTTTGSASVVPITALDNPVDGKTYTLLGCGGTYPPTIVKAGSFILASGVTWTALTGATITFKAIKSDTSAYTFVELSRS
jgi:hypothetical protein